MSERKPDLILLIKDIQSIEDRLREYERKYRLRSSAFYRLVQEGRIEQRLEIVEWLGLYELLQEREAEYQQLLESQVEPVLIALNSTPLPA